jgi:plastocyanin
MTARRFYLAIVLPAFILPWVFAALAMADGNLPAARHRHLMSGGNPTQAGAVIAVMSTTAATTAGNAIVIRNFAFEPATLTIVAGNKVSWTNRDEEPHQVVSAGAQFPASPALDTDDNYATVFTKPGTYTYFCSIHPHMVGTIIVKP